MLHSFWMADIGSKELYNAMKAFFEDKSLMDVTFLVKGVKIKAHRNFLNSCSPPFKALLSGGFLESKSTEITISDPLVTAECFQTFLEFVYLRSVQITLYNCFCLHHLADLYDFPSLKSSCEKFFSASISEENCLVMWDQANTWNHNSLAEQAKAMVVSKTAKCLASDDIVTVSEDVMYELVCSDVLSIPEIDLFLAVVKWLQANTNCKRKDEFMRKIRFGCINATNLAKLVKPTNLAPHDLLLLAFCFHGNPDEEIPEKFATSRFMIDENMGVHYVIFQ